MKHKKKCLIEMRGVMCDVRGVGAGPVSAQKEKIWKKKIIKKQKKK